MLPVIRTPRFKNYLHVYTVSPDLCFFLNKSGYQVLEGRLTYLLAPLINGKNTVSDIADQLKDQITSFDVECGLFLLEDEGYITYAKEILLPRAKVVRGSLDVDPKISAGVRIVSFGEISTVSFLSMLKKVGIRLTKEADFTIVLVDNYLREELKDFNQKAIHEKRRWMIVKPTGSVFWFGPVFSPPHTACWECLARRLREKLRVESLIQTLNGAKACFDPTSAPNLTSSSHAALKLVATEILRHLVLGNKNRQQLTLQTLDIKEMKLEKHAIVRFDSCVCLARPAKKSKSSSIPIVLRSRNKTSTSSAEKTYQKYEHHISPLTGIVHEVNLSHPKGPAYFCAASHLFVPPVEKQDLFRKVFKQRSAGKGMTLEQARTGALCEALERYSGVLRGEEFRIKATYKELRDEAIHPNSCMNFSEHQYENREKWNQSHSDQDWVPVPFDKRRRIEWTPVWSLSRKRIKYVPTAYCYYGYRLPPERKFCRADSNGNAAGNTVEEAILHGFMELVERDSIALWWYNRVRRPAVNLDSFALPYIKVLGDYYRKLGRNILVFDITSDFNIPVFAALSSRRKPNKPQFIMGFGADFDAAVALIRALTEMNQFLPPRNFEDGLCPPTDLDFLKPDPKLVPKNLQDFRNYGSNNFRDDVETCVKLAQIHGMETLVLNQTRSDVGLPVVKVIVPGMRSFWPRFGNGRLYDIPVQLGWLEKPLTENQLNPNRLLI